MRKPVGTDKQVCEKLNVDYLVLTGEMKFVEGRKRAF